MELTPDKTVVVTGAASGIGLAMSHAFATVGCSVVLADVQTDALERAEREIAAHGVETLAVRTDVSSREQVEELASATLKQFGGVHVVCNNAGVGNAVDPWFGPLEEWEWVMGVNFWGVVYGVRAFLPHLTASGSGHIVNTASMAGLFPGTTGPYGASKHAVVALTENLHSSLRAAQIPIGVSCVCPGFVRTGIVDSERNWPSHLGEVPQLDAQSENSRHQRRQAIQGGMEPADVANQVLRAITADRYWVFPDQEALQLAVHRFERIGQGLDPEPPAPFPGLQSGTSDFTVE